MDVILANPGVELCIGILRMLACWYLPGMVWGWLMFAGSLPWRKHSERYFAITVLNLLWSLLSCICLTVLRWHTPLGTLVSSDLLSGFFVMAGMLIGLIVRRTEMRAWMRASIPGFVLMLMVIGGILSLPHRGDWVAGGWDPGLYINEGILHAREGASAVPAGKAYAVMEQNQLDAVSRNFGSGYMEIMPGMVIDPVARTLLPVMTPAWPAVIGQSWIAGGSRAASRSPAIIAVIAVMIIGAIMVSLEMGWGAVLAATMAVVLQPLFWYHARVPLPEILELAIAGGILLMRFETRLSPAFRIFMTAGMLLVGVMNRISFAPLGATCLLVFAWTDRNCVIDRASILGALLGIVAVFAGITIDLRVSSSTLRLDHIWPALWALTLLLVGMILILRIFKNVCRDLFPARIDRWLPLAICAICVGVALSYGVSGRIALDAAVAGILPYTGICAVIFLCVALVLLLRPRVTASHETDIRLFLAILIGMVALLLINKWIADIYPWATRRFFVPLMMLYALAAAMVYTGAFRQITLRMAGIITAVVIACIAMANLPLCRRAFRAVEYEGLVPYVCGVAETIGAGKNVVVITDDSRLAMPLRCITGCDVFDIGFLLRDKTSKRHHVIMTIVQQLEKCGVGIWIATSNRETVSLLETATDRSARMHPSPAPIEVATVIHGPHVADFVLRTRKIGVTVYELVR